MNIQVIGTTCFSMSVRSTIEAHTWTLRDFDLVNEDETIFIPVTWVDSEDEEILKDPYRCTLLIDGKMYSISTIYYGINSDGEMDSYSF